MIWICFLALLVPAIAVAPVSSPPHNATKLPSSPAKAPSALLPSSPPLVAAPAPAPTPKKNVSAAKPPIAEAPAAKAPTASPRVAPAKGPVVAPAKSPPIAPAKSPPVASAKSPPAPIAPSPSPLAGVPSPSRVPTQTGKNGTLDPSQVMALLSLGISAGPNPCNTASQHLTICDEGTPYRHLISLQLDYCSDGAVFPSSAWANLTSLRSLTLNECPAKLMQLPSKLVGSLTSLTVIASLGRSVENVLAPGLPGTWLSNFHNLVELTVRDVLVNATSLGSIIANMTKLQQVAFANTNLTGSLPKSWPKNITSLEVSGNDVVGSIPPSVAQLKQLQMLDLSSNNLSGLILPDLGNLTALQTLKLESNKLRGPIPLSLQKLTALTYLDLSDNLLNGSMPVALSKLSGLRYVNLGKNYLRGEIPFNDTFLETLNTFKVTDNPDLCYNNTIVSAKVAAKFLAGVQPCDSSGLPVEGPGSGPAFAPAPAPEQHGQKSSGHHRGPKKIVLAVAIALASIVVVIVVAILLSRWCSRKDY